MNTLTFFRSLRNPVFARLYTAQTTSLLGDALTWVGLALLAFELAGKNAAVVLSVALTVRVTAFVLLSPLAGAIADRLDRKKIMVVTLVASIAGAQILVNTVGYVQGTLKLGEVQYGWVMAAFGIGATLCRYGNSPANYQFFRGEPADFRSLEGVGTAVLAGRQ